MIEQRGGKEIYITSKGRQLLDLVPEELRSPATTAEWEQKLELIAKGKLKKEVFINEMKQHTKKLLQKSNPVIRSISMIIFQRNHALIATNQCLK